MKGLLTLTLLEKYDNPPDAPCGEAQVLCADGDTETFKNLIKKAEGKYTVFLDSDFSFGDVYPFISALDKTTADAVRFNGGVCFKTSLLKFFNYTGELYRFPVEFDAALSCKSLAAVKAEPFEFTNKLPVYDATDGERIFNALEQFGKYKGKLKTEIYSFAFDLVCGKIFAHYAGALKGIYKKTESAQDIIDFDKRLREDIVVSLAVDKRFNDFGINLAKLRGKDFKVPYFTYLKLKKL